MQIHLILSTAVADNPEFFPVSYASPITGIKPYSRKGNEWTIEADWSEVRRLIKKYYLRNSSLNIWVSEAAVLCVGR